MQDYYSNKEEKQSQNKQKKASSFLHQKSNHSSQDQEIETKKILAMISSFMQALRSDQLSFEAALKTIKDIEKQILLDNLKNSNVVFRAYTEAKFFFENYFQYEFISSEIKTVSKKEFIAAIGIDELMFLSLEDLKLSKAKHQIATKSEKSTNYQYEKAMRDYIDMQTRINIAMDISYHFSKKEVKHTDIIAQRYLKNENRIN